MIARILRESRRVTPIGSRDSCVASTYEAPGRVLVDQQGSENGRPSATHHGRPIIQFDPTTFGDGVSDCRLNHFSRFGLKAEVFQESGNV